jgi:hypothetical protein
MWDLLTAKEGWHPLDGDAQCNDASIMLDSAAFIARRCSLAREMWSSNVPTKVGEMKYRSIKCTVLFLIVISDCETFIEYKSVPL